MKAFDFFQNIAREGDAAGAAAASPAAAPAAPALVQAATQQAADPAAAPAAPALVQAATQQAADPAAAPAAADPAAPYFPEGLPEQFKGANERETLDKIAKDFADRPKPPEAADKYDFSLMPEDFVKKFGDLKDDPVVPFWKEIAHELGLSNDQARDAIPKLYEKMQSAGLIDDPVDVKAELQQLMPETGDPIQKQAAATARLQGAVNLIQAMTTRSELSTGEANALTQTLATADGVKAVEKLMQKAQVQGLTPGGAPAGKDGPDLLQKMYPTMFKATA